MEKSDELLVQEYISGDDNALKILIDRYTSSIYNFSARFVGRDYANDIVQEVFIKVWKNLKKFDIKKAGFKTWIFTIARNTITDYLRKKKPILFSDIDKEDETFADNIEDEVILPDEAMAKLEDQEFLNKLLDQIPTKYREVLVLYYQEDMTFNEIGKMLEKPLNTVKSHHRRALLLLKEMLLK